MSGGIELRVRLWFVISGDLEYAIEGAASLSGADADCVVVARRSADSEGSEGGISTIPCEAPGTTGCSATASSSTSRPCRSVCGFALHPPSSREAIRMKSQTREGRYPAKIDSRFMRQSRAEDGTNLLVSTPTPGVPRLHQLPVILS